VIPLVRVFNGLRQEGLNYGVPTTFVVLGGGTQIQLEDLLEEVLKKSIKRGWICLKGQDFDPLSMGVGTLVRGLSQLQRFVEIETDGLHRDPRWAHTVDRWIVLWHPTVGFNLGSLRATDGIKFRMDQNTALEEVKRFLEACKDSASIKYVLMEDGSWIDEVFEMVRTYERSRMY